MNPPGEFLSWLSSERGIYICMYNETENLFYQASTIRKEGLLGEFFGIDQKKLEEEKQSMLESVRNSSTPK